ncbi:MAG TPA: RHS repeat-associated core domain-containing protein, partial [Polyangiaceae bacterium]|nr:RHS repeat-associated core domain-containing protein [Polyangiaceae bacterium]
ESRTDADGSTSFDYDSLGNLAAVTLPGGSAIRYLTDARGRRVQRSVDGTVTHAWLYQSDLNPVAELDATGAVVSRFVYASRAHIPDFMVRGGTTYRIVSDLRGSVRLVVNAANGTVAQRIDYGPFGEVVADSSPGFQPFGFAGGLYDSSTGLVHFGARDYDAEVGRWTSKDPIGFAGGQNNLYGYVANDPVNAIDPEGEAALVGAAIGGGLDFAWQMYRNGGRIECVSWGEVGLAALGGAVGLPRLRAVTGPLKQWVRVGSSYSRAGGFPVRLSVRWGASPARGGRYLQQIGSPRLRAFNQWLRSGRLPGSSWRVQDPGHIHILR